MAKGRRFVVWLIEDRLKRGVTAGILGLLVLMLKAPVVAVVLALVVYAAYPKVMVWWSEYQRHGDEHVSNQRDALLIVVDELRRDARTLLRRSENPTDDVQMDDVLSLVRRVRNAPTVLSEDYPVAASKLKLLAQDVDEAIERNRFDIIQWMRDLVDAADEIRRDLSNGIL